MNNNKIFSICICIFCVSFASHGVLAGENKVNLLATDQVNENKNSQNVIKNHTQQKQNMKESPELRNNRRSWSDAFEPSEKINADSVISFPVDI